MIPTFTQPHEYAEIFSLHDEGILELSKRIKAHGQREPIVRLDGKILDGRRRERACNMAGVDPIYREFGSRKTDGDDPLDFVMDLNLHRRHLGEGERIIAAGRYATAKAGKPKPCQADKVSEKTIPEAAERFNISESTVSRAKKVVLNGTPELQQAVKEEVIAVSDAAAVVEESPAKQNGAVHKVKTGKAKTVRQAVAEPETIKDGLKCEVPESLESIFEKCGEFRSIMKGISDLRSRIKELAKDKSGGWIDEQDVDRQLNQAHKHLRFAMPFTECPKCRRKAKKDCSACKGTGWINETVYGSSASDADKKWLGER